MYFQVDNQIEASSNFIGDLSLSRVYLKNEANFPWIILVPRQQDVQEIYQLSETNRHTLMKEITELSKIMHDFFKPDKLNIGALGNMIPQLHVHIVARFKTDLLWPEGIWQSFLPTAYSSKMLEELTDKLREKVISRLRGDEKQA